VYTILQSGVWVKRALTSRWSRRASVSSILQR
jgi:hypothetical protein